MEPFTGYGLAIAGLILAILGGVDPAPWSRWYRGIAGALLVAAGFIIVWGQ